MITRKEMERAQDRAAAMLARAGIVLTPEERANIEVADLGLGDLERIGLQLVTYVNTDRYCAKELVLFPRQTCPEHRHPAAADRPGKMETFRCRWGHVWLYVPGEPTEPIHARLPEDAAGRFTVFHEIELNPGEQHTLAPDTLHWFQAGDAGAIVSEFSSPNTDDLDLFTDPRLTRPTRIADDSA